jgi:hypothetical protein
MTDSMPAESYLLLSRRLFHSATILDELKIEEPFSSRNSGKSSPLETGLVPSNVPGEGGEIHVQKKVLFIY